MLLALDTSTRFAGIALYTDAPDRGLVAETNWHAGMQHTVSLMPHVSQMLDAQDIRVTDLTAIAVALGPGSFTGLRVGLAAAKGLALATGAPLIGIPTLDSRLTRTACNRSPSSPSYRPGAAAFVGQLQPELRSVCRQRIHPLRHLQHGRGRERPGAFCRRAVTRRPGRWPHAWWKAAFWRPALAVRRAGCLAEMGVQRHLSGQHDDIAALNASICKSWAARRRGRGSNAAEMPTITPMVPADIDAIMIIERQVFHDPWVSAGCISDRPDDKTIWHLSGAAITASEPARDPGLRRFLASGRRCAHRDHCSASGLAWLRHGAMATGSGCWMPQ